MRVRAHPFERARRPVSGGVSMIERGAGQFVAKPDQLVRVTEV